MCNSYTLARVHRASSLGDVRQWLLPAAVSCTLWACSSAPNSALFNGQVNGNPTGGSNPFGFGGTPSFGGANFGGSGNTLPFETGGFRAETGGVPIGAGGIPVGAGGILVGSGGFGTGGSPFDGSFPTGGFFGVGGFSTGGLGPIDSGTTGGGGPVDAHPVHDCPAGSYSGTLSGPYSSIVGSTTFVADFQFSVDSSGAIKGTWTGTSDTTSKATLTGSMNCQTGETSISVRGSYRGIIGGTVAYQGTMTGSYDWSTSSFSNGKWELSEPNGSGSGSGTWSTK